MFNFSLAANLCFKDIFLSPKSSVKIQKTFFYTLQALYSVKCVLVDERGVMWIGTRFGLNRFDREKITVYQEERENPHSLPYNDIVFLEEDAEGNIGVGTSCGLAYFDRGTFRNLLLSLLPVIFIFLEWKGWLGYGPAMTFMRKRIFL